MPCFSVWALRIWKIRSCLRRPAAFSTASDSASSVSSCIDLSLMSATFMRSRAVGVVVDLVLEGLLLRVVHGPPAHQARIPLAVAAARAAPATAAAPAARPVPGEGCSRRCADCSRNLLFSDGGLTWCGADYAAGKSGADSPPRSTGRAAAVAAAGPRSGCRCMEPASRVQVEGLTVFLRSVDPIQKLTRILPETRLNLSIELTAGARRCRTADRMTGGRGRRTPPGSARRSQPGSTCTEPEPERGRLESYPG